VRRGGGGEDESLFVRDLVCHLARWAGDRGEEEGIAGRYRREVGRR
jgi:hypothetical protein